MQESIVLRICTKDSISDVNSFGEHGSTYCSSSASSESSFISGASWMVSVSFETFDDFKSKYLKGMKKLSRDH